MRPAAPVRITSGIERSCAASTTPHCRRLSQILDHPSRVSYVATALAAARPREGAGLARAGPIARVFLKGLRMRLSTKGRYAVMAMADLARQGDRAVCLAEI